MINESLRNQFANYLKPTQDEIVNVWCKALESGKYKKGTGELCSMPKNENDEPKYCCLGILTDIYQQVVGDLIEDKICNRKTYDLESIVLPEKVRKWAGIKTIGGKYGEWELWRDNDSGESFPNISEIIKKERKNLFIQSA